MTWLAAGGVAAQLGTIQKLGLDLDRPELRLRHAHPVLLVDTRDRLDENLVSESFARTQAGGCGDGRSFVAEKRGDAGPLPAGRRGHAGLVEHRLLGGATRVGVFDRDRERTPFVGQPVRYRVDGLGRNEQRERVHRAGLSACADRASLPGSGCWFRLR